MMTSVTASKTNWKLKIKFLKHTIPSFVLRNRVYYPYLHVLRVRRAGHVAVDLLGRRLVLRLELRLDVRSGLAVLLRA